MTLKRIDRQTRRNAQIILAILKITERRTAWDSTDTATAWLCVLGIVGMIGIGVLL